MTNDELPKVSPRPFCRNESELDKRDFYHDPIIVYESEHSQDIEELGNCPIRCISTGQSAYLQTGDIAILSMGGNAPHRNDRPCKDLRYMTSSMESEVHYPQLAEVREGRTNFDWVASYRLDSNNPVAYFDWRTFDYFRKVEKKHKSNVPTVVSFISNCGPQKRLDYIRALSKYIPVENYGECLKNQAGRPHKSEVIPYKEFTLVFENSETLDYSTEKLYDALSYGSVPVVLGPPNVGRLVPDLHSYIDVKDFASPKELADYLIFLHKNPIRYNEYLDWKTRGFDPIFEKRIDMSLLHSRCRLCLSLAGMNYENFLWWYKKSYLATTQLAYVPPSPDQPDWSDEYEKYERDIRLLPGTAGSAPLINNIRETWNAMSMGTLHDGLSEYEWKVPLEEYYRNMELLKYDKVHSSLCDVGTGIIIRSMREIEYIIGVDGRYAWDDSPSAAASLRLPMEICYDKKNGVARAILRVKTYEPPPTTTTTTTLAPQTTKLTTKRDVNVYRSPH